MLTAVKGVFRNGKIELAEQPCGVEDGAEAVITFLTPTAEEPPRQFLDLYGAWEGLLPDDVDLEASIKEIATQWKEDFADDLV